MLVRMGTPATRAGVTERLISSGLAQRKAKQIIPTEKGRSLITVLPDALKSPTLTTKWEEQLAQVERGELSDAAFMEGIAAMTRKLVATHPAPDPARAALFAQKPSGEVIGSCPRCGGSVHEGKKGFFCASRACGFVLWKDSRFSKRGAFSFRICTVKRPARPMPPLLEPVFNKFSKR